MDQINWLSSISKVSSLIAEINDLLRNRVSVASDDDSNQNLVEAVWEEEHRWRQNQIQVDTDCCNAVLATSREYAPRLAYQQTEKIKESWALTDRSRSQLNRSCKQWTRLLPQGELD